MKPKIITIVGPTASGKTALSIAIAKEFDGEVISADSRQVYRSLDIGTEKVTKEEMDGIPHHLLDVADPALAYSADDFEKDASVAIEEIVSRQNLPIIAGGTFFYIDTLLGKIGAPQVPPNPELRAKLEEMSTEVLYHSLEELDPERALDVDPHNKRRIMRALEIIAAAGKVPKRAPVECPYDVLTLGIKTDKKELRARLRARAQEALTKGLVEETEKLLQNGLTKERLSEIGLEYRVIMEYMEGTLTDEQLIQKLEEKNWQYAKRQLTWLKRDDSIQWFDLADIEKIISTIQKFLTDQS